MSYLLQNGFKYPISVIYLQLFLKNLKYITNSKSLMNKDFTSYSLGFTIFFITATLDRHTLYAKRVYPRI